MASDLAAQARSCSRCGRLFSICRSCDRGHRYCGPPCSREARTESVRRARKRHRQSPEGRADHRDRERERRRRQRIRVGDQGSAAAVTVASVPDPEPLARAAELPDPEISHVIDALRPAFLRCIRCRTVTPWLRLAPRRARVLQPRFKPLR